MIKKFLPIISCIFSNDLFALKKCIGNLTSNKKIGYQAFNEHSAEKLIVGNIFEIWGQWCKFRDISQNIKVVIKNKVDLI